VNALGFVKMASTKTENGITYNVYIHSDANTDAKAALWVQRGVSIKGMQRGFVINGETADDLSPAQETEGPKEPLSSLIVSLLIRKPPMPEAIANKSMAVPSCLPKTTYALPSCAGDVNGDGLDDLILGAYTADPNGKLDAGKSYVVFGKANGSVVNLSAIASEAPYARSNSR
jgi:hypothetical protein